ncbi:MAG: hypothetical protein HYY62_02225 [Deltaproteobacteria bacterium]|nr:hypothetical protein [Deltaproteobacteria bacterium]
MKKTYLLILSLFMTVSPLLYSQNETEAPSLNSCIQTPWTDTKQLIV